MSTPRTHAVDEINQHGKDTEKKSAKVKSISANRFALISEFLLNTHPDLAFNLTTFKLEDNGTEVTQRRQQSMYVAMTSISPEHEKIKHSDWLLYLGSEHVRSYNPLADYCAGLDVETPLTGKIKELAECLTLDPIQGMKTEDVIVFLRRWLIGVFAGIFDGNHNPLFIVFVGPKGCGKTYLIRHLLPKGLKKYFAEMEMTGNHKEDGDLVCSFLIAFVDEMDRLKRFEANRLRALLSKDEFTYQPPYGRGNVTRKRLASFIGASNKVDIILDKQNNRRIVPICITSIDWPRFNAIDKDELFREAFKLYYDGEDWNLTKDEMTLLDKLTGVNEVQDLETEMLLDYYVKDEDGCVFSTDIANALQQATNIKLNPINIGKALASCGFEKKAVKKNGKVRYGWKVRNIKNPFA